MVAEVGSVGPMDLLWAFFWTFGVELSANFCLGLFPLDPRLWIFHGAIVVFRVMLGSCGYKIYWYHPAWVVEDCMFSPKSIQNVSTLTISWVLEQNNKEVRPRTLVNPAEDHGLTSVDSFCLAR